MFAKTACILISGKAGVGKSTFGGLLRDAFYKEDEEYFCTKTGFALGIKQVATKFIGWDGEKDEKGRKLLQTLGTEVGRKYNINCWVSYLIDKWIPESELWYDVIIIDDWRFPNEADYIRENKLYKVFTIRIVSSKREDILCDEAKNHASETSLTDSLKYDYVIKNDFDLEYLNSEAILIAKDIIEKTNY